MNKKIGSTIVGLTLLSLVALAHALDRNDRPTSQAFSLEAPTQGPKLFKTADEDNTAKCLAECRKDFEKCSDNGTKNVPACVKKRKECINNCA